MIASYACFVKRRTFYLYISLQNSTKSAKIKKPCQKGRKEALLQKQRLARSPSKSIGKGGEAGMGRFLLKLFVLVVILALALSIKAY